MFVYISFSHFTDKIYFRNTGKKYSHAYTLMSHELENSVLFQVQFRHHFDACLGNCEQIELVGCMRYLHVNEYPNV